MLILNSHRLHLYYSLYYASLEKEWEKATQESCSDPSKPVFVHLVSFQPEIKNWFGAVLSETNCLFAVLDFCMLCFGLLHDCCQWFPNQVQKHSCHNSFGGKMKTRKKTIWTTCTISHQKQHYTKNKIFSNLFVVVDSNKNQIHLYGLWGKVKLSYSLCPRAYEVWNGEHRSRHWSFTWKAKNFKQV